MPRIWTSAAYRIAFVYSAAFALTIGLLAVAIYFAADATFRRQQDARIASEAAGLVRDFNDEGLGDLKTAIAAREAGTTTNSFGYVLFGGDGSRLAGSLRTKRPEAGWSNILFEDPEEGADPARALATDLPGGLRLVVAADAEAVERIDHTILTLFAGAFVAVVGIGVAGAVLLGVYLRRRLDRITRTAHAINSGKLEARIPVSSRHDEFDQLSLALNAMLDRISSLLENLRQVSSDVAHDLRTPLARLHNQLEQAATLASDNDTLRNSLERATDQSNHLLNLFAALLRISEIEAGAIARNFVRLNLSDLARDLCESITPAVSDGERTLSWVIEPGILVRGDRELIAQAVINLLDNAQRHTPTDSHIVLALSLQADEVRLSVSDDGPGIAVQDRDRVVRRFARLETSRTTPGHGLGLNLVAAIANAHGGKMSLEDNAPGLRIVLTFEGLSE